jgi:osmotically-inducible protein OsmY
MPHQPNGIFLNNHEDDSRFIDRDYSLGGGVSMVRKDFEHGFGTYQNKKNEEDDHLLAEVNKGLAESTFIDISEVDVSVKDKVILLKGWVNSREEKLEALKVAFQVDGVQDVQLQLLVRNRKLNHK